MHPILPPNVKGITNDYICPSYALKNVVVVPVSRICGLYFDFLSE